MPYGIVHRLLLEEFSQFNDVVLIESPFKETTRQGRYLRSVLLALTPNKLIIANCHCHFKGKYALYGQNLDDFFGNKTFELRSLHPLETVKLAVFKLSRRQSLKACFLHNDARYFELGELSKRKMFWKLWRKYVAELNRRPKVWPFSPSETVIRHPKQLREKLSNYEIPAINSQTEKKNFAKWTDKYLYMGSKREIEDNDRPKPIPGLGRAEEIKLLYLKPRYFGCWDQSEHWVQCKDSALETPCDYDVYTYTGEPTCNVTYTSCNTSK